MVNFIWGMLTMWFILSIIIVIGNDKFDQSCDEWGEWYILLICFPFMVLVYPFCIIIDLIKSRRKGRK